MTETAHHTHTWIENHHKVLFSLCVILGSAFAAVELCSCHLFYKSYFGLELDSQTMKSFRHLRLYSVVLFENIPQLIILILFSVLSDTVTEITIISAIFSMISIMISTFEFRLENILAKNNQSNAISLVAIKFEIISSDIASLSHKSFQNIANHRRDIVYQLRKILNSVENVNAIDAGNGGDNGDDLNTFTYDIEMPSPVHTKSGCKIIFLVNIPTHGPLNAGLIKSAIHASITDQSIAQIFANNWKDSALLVKPTINAESLEIIQSEMSMVEIKNTELMMANVVARPTQNPLPPNSPHSKQNQTNFDYV